MNRDLKISNEVVREMKSDPLLSPIASDIRVETHGNVVILYGTVDSYLKKNAAEEAALRVKDVEAVEMEIDVVPN